MVECFCLACKKKCSPERAKADYCLMRVPYAQRTFIYTWNRHHFGMHTIPQSTYQFHLRLVAYHFWAICFKLNSTQLKCGAERHATTIFWIQNIINDPDIDFNQLTMVCMARSMRGFMCARLVPECIQFWCLCANETRCGDRYHHWNGTAIEWPDPLYSICFSLVMRFGNFRIEKFRKRWSSMARTVTLCWYLMGP